MSQYDHQGLPEEPTRSYDASIEPPAPAAFAGEPRDQRTTNARCVHKPSVGDGLDPEPTSISHAAIASCVLGVFGLVGMVLIGPFSLLASFVGLPLGWRARKEIRHNPAVEGDTLAYTGIITSWIGIALVVLMVLILLVAVFFGVAIFQGMF